MSRATRQDRVAHLRVMLDNAAAANLMAELAELDPNRHTRIIQIVTKLIEDDFDEGLRNLPVVKR